VEDARAEVVFPCYFEYCLFGGPQITNLKKEMERRTDRLKRQEKKFQDMPDIVVKVVCKYRAELFFKISRKTKLSRLFNAWTERMDVFVDHDATQLESKLSKVASAKKSSTHFIFTYRGRVVESTQTPEEIGLEEGDEILAVEMLDLTHPDTVCVCLGSEVILTKVDAGARV
jgi:hypothetical protein